MNPIELCWAILALHIAGLGVTGNTGSIRFVQPLEFPNVGRISIIDLSKGFRNVVECGCAVISPVSVVTVCHCLARLIEPNKAPTLHNTELSTVTAGTLYKNSSEDPLKAVPQVRLGQAFHVHPMCRKIDTTSFITNDVGVVEVKTPFELNLVVQPSRLPPLGQRDLAEYYRSLEDSSETCVVVGWDSSSTGQRLEVLKVTVLPVVTCKNNGPEVATDQCSTFLRLRNIDEGFIGATSTDLKMLRIMSGSPLICKAGRVAGLVTIQLDHSVLEDSQKCILLFSSFLTCSDLIAKHLKTEVPATTVSSSVSIAIETTSETLMVDTSTLLHPTSWATETVSRETWGSSTEPTKQFKPDLSTVPEHIPKSETENPIVISETTALVAATKIPPYPVWTVRLHPEKASFTNRRSVSAHFVFSGVTMAFHNQ